MCVCAPTSPRLLDSSTEALTSDLWSVDDEAGGHQSAPSPTPLPAGGQYRLGLSGASRREEEEGLHAPGQSHDGHWARQTQPSAGERTPQGGEDAGVGLRAGFLNLGFGAQRLDAEGDLALPAGGDGPYRQSTPVFDSEDEVGDGAALGGSFSLGWACDRAGGRSRDCMDGGRSPGKPLVMGASAVCGAEGPGLTVDWTRGDRSPGASAAYGRRPGDSAGGGPASAEGLGRGGGAFKLFQRGATPLQSSAPPQSGSSPGGTTAAAAASYLWQADQSVTV